MRRKIYDKLLEWKRVSSGKTAVMLDGTRRIGVHGIGFRLCSSTLPNE